MKRSAIPRSVWAAGLVLCGVFSGCAVLTVDVDVYKGTLVNEEHVQLHQLVALATAAKPMLVQLRDSIEWPSEEMPVKTAKDQRGWYEPGYVSPPIPQVPPEKGWWCKRANYFCPEDVNQYPFFRNNLAVRVNAVLGLYEELDQSGKKKPYVKEGEEEGLKRLTEIFREVSRKLDHDNLEKHQDDLGKKLSLAEHRLIDVLVEFSSKVLFLANHEGLVSPPGTQGLIVGGAEKLNRGLFGDFLTDKGLYSLLNSGLVEGRKQQYVRVLQAVGNSILFSANELRERDRYRELNEEKTRAEVDAANEIYSPSPWKVVDELLQELRYEKEQAQKKIKESEDRQDALSSQIGRETPATGVYILLNAASDELKAAEKSLDAYLTMHRQLAGLYQLLTDEVKDKLKRLWKEAGKENASTLDDLLVGSDGLKTVLQTFRTAQDGIPTPEESRKFEDAVKYIESADTRKTFEAHQTEGGKISTKRADLLDDFTAHIRQLEADRARRVAQYEKVRDEKKLRYQEVQSSLEQLTKELKDVESLLLQLLNKINRFGTASNVLLEVKVDVVHDAEKATPFVSPNTVYTLIALHVNKEKEAAASGTQQRYQDALEVLSRRTPPLGMPTLIPGKYQSPLAVMDKVIALLRHQQMRAVERFGKDSDADKHATEALENASQHRAGMIYIRPSSAYLRTSFPSTSLQDDPNLAWDNLLLKQGIRNLPFSSQLADILDPSVRQDRLLTSELDKQYWQNINRVRVSGAGWTNQALVKDDVGNWYVKHYFGDTEKIVKSAKHLALFGLGTKLPIDLSYELRKASRTQDESQKSAADKESDAPPLQKVFGKHSTAYQVHSVDTATKLADLHGTEDGKKTVYGQILAAWKGADWEGVDESKKKSLMETLTAALKEEVSQWDKTAEPLKKASDQERGLAIIKDLNVLARLEKGLSARIRRDVTSSEPEKAKAIRIVHRVVGPVLLDLLEDHKRALDRYEQAMLFIGAAANPKDPKQEQGK